MNFTREHWPMSPGLTFLLALVILTAGPWPAWAAEKRQFTFAWPFVEGETMQPRGGTTRGAEVELRDEPSEAFQQLREPGLSDLEHDRRAILAMAGDYRVSFDFLEVMGFEQGFSPAAPYQSWGTERIYVLEDRRDFISLQHILVMRPVDENGQKLDPVVIKHWRQDWQYGADSMHAYEGHNTWLQTSIPQAAGEDYWVQTVWQVDDSPRYASWGQWEHHTDYSTWQSDETWRPLPRREFSVRDDYDVLIGTNRHTIVPSGWVQEEENMKVALTDSGEPRHYLAKEYGIARYEAIRDYDFSAADEYLQATAAFWTQVRAYWHDKLKANKRIHLRAQVDQAGLFRPFFERAQAIADGEDYSRQQNSAFIEKTLRGYFTDGPVRNKPGY